MKTKDINRLRVEESSQVGEARRLAASMGKDLGLDEDDVGCVSIVVTELATNLVKHGGGGDLILRVLRIAGTSGIEALSLDKGPGIKDIGKCLRDGYSTSGSPGTGLGAIQRLSSLFDIYSKPGWGTAVLSRIRRKLPSASASPWPIEVGVVCLPIMTEEACGDAWALHQTHERALIMLADGLGHGPDAAAASAAAVDIFDNYSRNGPVEMIERMHAAMLSTRGAAVAVTEVLWEQRVVRFAGVGNISGRIFSGDAFCNMVSHNGTVGFEARNIVEFTYPWPEDGLLVLHSDGLATRWNLDDYPGLRGRNPALIAGVLFRDHNRVRDDSTVVVIRETRRMP
jgi:anti-sigma regulatory factor (Ser/Thr protein kinase)